MKLSDLSTKNVVFATPDEPVDQAVALMEKHGIRHLPVLSAGQVVGMVSDRDLLTAGAVGMPQNTQAQTDSADTGTQQEKPPPPVRVSDIMSQPVFTLSPDDALRSATWLMVNRRVHAIPLVRGDRLVGMVTEADLLSGVIMSRELTPGGATEEFLQRPIGSYVRGKLTTVGPKNSLDEVVDIMRGKQIRHLPVVVDDELLGMVSDRDVRRAFGDAATLDAKAQDAGEYYLGPSTVREIMSTSVQSVASTTTTRAAIEQMLQHRIHCLAVVDEKPVGVITDTDLLRAIGTADKEGTLP